MKGSFYIVLFAILFGSQILAQTDAGCPSIDIGEDLQIECANTCVDLTADVLEVGNTISYVVESIDYSPFPFNQGTPILVGLDDVWSELIPIPFEFCFFENSYNELVIGANGVITFDTDFASPPNFNWFNGSFCDWDFNLPIPNTTNTPYRNSINGAYHDIDPSIAGNIRIDVVGEAPCRIFIINYEDIPHYSFPTSLCSSITTSQQILLYETTNVIEVIIEDKPVCEYWNNGNAVIGIQNINGTVGYVPPDRNTGEWFATNEAWRFVPSENESFEIEWFDQDGMSLGNGTEVTVCPNINSTYSATVTYTACNGTEVSESDAISVSIIGEGPISSTFITACDSVLWNGNWYDETGTYDTTFTANSEIGSNINNQGNNWCFGWSAGLNFNSNPPSAFISGVSTEEGCATVSSNTGDLLFYTDGVNVWDQNHNLMQNGYGLTGHPSSTQSATIVQKPGSENSYYIFTLDGIGSGFPIFWDGLYYSEVDMTLNNGLGGVIESTKNTSIISHTSEKIVVIEHSNGQDFWIIVRLENYDTQNSNTYHSYLLTQNGLTTNPVISNVGPLYYHTLGYLKASPNGNKIAAANTRTIGVNVVDVVSDFNVFDFDNTTGYLSNPMTFIFPWPGGYGNAPYGLEFSPNGNLLYVSSGDFPYNLIQFNLLAGSQQEIDNSSINITGISNNGGGALQLGPNGKIYHAMWGEPYLGAINNPNEVGLACDYITEAVGLVNGTLSQGGLPTFQNTIFEPEAPVCDSTAVLYLTINEPTSSSTSVSSCESYEWNGNTYSVSGSYEFLTTNSNGCDSIATLNLTINTPTSSVTDIVACEEYFWNNNLYTTSGSYTYESLNANGCDSIATLNLLISSSTSSLSEVESCVPVQWNGNTYDSSGEYVFNTVNSNGCDSTAVLSLTINQISSSLTEINSCESYLWNGITYNSSGVYTYETINENGCDSIATLDLNIYASSASFTIAEECNEYSWNGNTYTTSGTYLLEFQDVNGCDSTATLSLTINEPTTSTTIVNDCEPYVWNGALYEETGSFTYLTINNNGCDSTAILELTINPSTSSLTTISSCEPYEWNGSLYDTSGSYSFQTFNENGCDSIANLDLTIADVSTSFSTASSCEEYIWNGDTYITSGVYEYQSTDINGCDSIATLELTINSPSASLTLASSCTDYFWNGNNYYSSGIYEYQTVNSNGCDSIASLELTITPPTSSTTSISTCDEYAWNGSTYSSSGQYTYQTLNSSGCDSIANLNLTINSPTSSISNISSCVPITWNGELYNSTGIYDFLTTNSNGCDSVATLNLVINEDLIDETYTTVNSCEKFVWNDETYITSGDYIYVSSNQYGCDSLSYLSLNIYSNYIYVPTAFTPDNDGVNDAFKVESDTLQVFELNIYNRWGEKIFKTNSLNEPWDGSYNNGNYFCPDGVYTWQVKYRCKSEVYEKRGHVNMLR